MFILASNSPRRRELLSLVIDNYKVCPSSVEEVVPEGMSAENLPEYLARLKALDISTQYLDDIVIGADTAVIVGDAVLGKPKSRDDAKAMLKLLSGKKHKVITGCAVCKNRKCHSFSEVTEVEFYDLTDAEINAYVSTDEPFDKAGGYGIQGKGALLVKEIKGDYFNVVGLPVSHLVRFLKENNI